MQEYFDDPATALFQQIYVGEVSVMRASESTFEGMVTLQMQGYNTHQISVSTADGTASCGRPTPGPWWPYSADEKEHTHEEVDLRGTDGPRHRPWRLWPKPTPSLPTSGGWATASESAPGHLEHTAWRRKPISGRTRLTAADTRSGSTTCVSYRCSAHVDAARRGPRCPRPQPRNGTYGRCIGMGYGVLLYPNDDRAQTARQ